MSKKVIYISSAVLLGLFSIFRYLSFFVIDDTTAHAAQQKYLPYLISIAIALCSIYFYFFTKIFPNGWKKQNLAGKIAIPIIFACLSLAVAIQVFFALNLLLPPNKKEKLKGRIAGMSIEETGRRRTNFYKITVVVKAKEEPISFSVSKKAYMQYSVGDSINQELYTSPFGVKYLSK